ATAAAPPLNASEAEAGRRPTRQSQQMRDCRAATLNTVSPPLRDSYPATIMPLPRCRIPILTVAGLIEIAALQPPPSGLTAHTRPASETLHVSSRSLRATATMRNAPKPSVLPSQRQGFRSGHSGPIFLRRRCLAALSTVRNPFRV